MRTKTLGRRRKRRRSANRPFLTTTQDEYGASEYDTSPDNDGDLRDVPTANCIDQHSSESPFEVLNHESVDSLDKRDCISCKKGEEGVLVCSEKDCPVAFHAKCLSTEPKFDDSGNLYCPYCWYKRVVYKCQEMKRKVMLTKKALLNFLDEDEVTSDKLVQKEEDAKRKGPDDGDGISLGGENKQGTDGVDIQSFQPKGDEPRQLQNSDSNRCEITLEDQADGGDCDFSPCREEEMLVGISQVQDSMNEEKFDEPNKTETREIRLSQWKESLEIKDSRHNTEDVHERIDEVAEEAEPLSVMYLGNCTDRHSPDIALAKGTQESVTKSSEKGRMRGEGKKPHREQKVSATGSSVSETNDSDSGVISGRKRHGKRKVKKTSYPQNVATVGKSLLQEHNTKGENPSDINKEVTSSRTRRYKQSLSKPVNNWTSMIRRKKLPWSAEEEEALRDGVLRFSKEKQNVPWKTILQSGHHVFDKTRTPVDLKDKWRNMIS